jgi:arylsulfatase
MGFLGENDFINTKQSSFDITAEVESAKGTTTGVIVSQAGRFGGWSLYVKNNKPTYVYNFLGMNSYAITSDTTLPSGKSTVKLDFAIDDPKKLGSGGMATLYINGKKVGSGRVEKTHYGVWSFDETANVGIDRETAVTPDYTEETSEFTGKIDKVTIELKK